MNEQQEQQRKSKKALWIILAVVGFILLIALIQMTVVGLFSGSVNDLWDGASEQLGQPMKP